MRGGIAWRARWCEVLLSKCHEQLCPKCLARNCALSLLPGQPQKKLRLEHWINQNPVTTEKERRRDQGKTITSVQVRGSISSMQLTDMQLWALRPIQTKMPKGREYQAVRMCLLEKKGLAVRPSVEEKCDLTPDPALFTLRQLQELHYRSVPCTDTIAHDCRGLDAIGASHDGLLGRILVRGQVVLAPGKRASMGDLLLCGCDPMWCQSWPRLGYPWVKRERQLWNGRRKSALRWGVIRAIPQLPGRTGRPVVPGWRILAVARPYRVTDQAIPMAGFQCPW